MPSTVRPFDRSTIASADFQHCQGNDVNIGRTLRSVDPARTRCVDLMRMPRYSIGAHCLRSALGYLALMFASLAAPSLFAQDRVPQPSELKLSTALSPSFPVGRAGERWAQLVNDKAGGKYEIRQYPGAVLAQRDPGHEFGALQEGLADLAVGSALAWSAQLAPLAVYSLPWLAVDAREQEALAADSALRAKLFALMETSGVVGLAIAPLGERVVATAKRPVDSPAALVGLRMRVMSLRCVIDVYLALGALPQSMSFAQAQAAFAAGTLDGQDSMPTTLVATRASANGQKFVTRWGAFTDVMVFAVRKAVWDTWSEDRRMLVRSAAEQAAREANALSREEAALAQLTKEGVTIVRLSPTQRAAMRDAAQPAIAAWTNAVGVDYVHAARAAVESVGK
jgi:TRAP-type transport system periplasmic protein